MPDVYLVNTLTKKKNKFIPLKKGKVGVYSCGPTVYWNQHIGHMYAYIHWDTMVRFFRYLGFKVKWVVNITDVGHMTSDEDIGEDKMEKGARREGLSVWDLAEKYIKQFLSSLEHLNIQKPDVLPRATEHIEDQIKLAKLIEKNSFTYKTKMGLVFDTSKFKKYAEFANLSLDKQKKRKDVEDDPEKKVPWDFFLWVVGNPKHIMQWDSPWGRGYPGWHVECTAMSTKYLGNRFDIHTGGREHIPVHHTNEIAQAYGAYKKQTANYWLHNEWLTLRGEKMSKSLGNIYTIDDLIKKGYNPMHFRYLVLNSHYRKGIVFSWKALDGAKNAYERLVNLIRTWKRLSRTELSESKLDKIEGFKKKFVKNLADDLNYPGALAVLWEVAKSNIPNTDKLDLTLEFDKVLGLGLAKVSVALKVPKTIKQLVRKREELRKKGNFKEADKVRKEIQTKGYLVEDTKKSPIIKPARNGK